MVDIIILGRIGGCRHVLVEAESFEIGSFLIQLLVKVQASRPGSPKMDQGEGGHRSNEQALGKLHVHLFSLNMVTLGRREKPVTTKSTCLPSTPLPPPQGTPKPLPVRRAENIVKNYKHSNRKRK